MIRSWHQISLKIYDISGKEINELANDFYVPGVYDIKWTGVDSYGNTVSSGIYIFRREALNRAN